MRARSRIKERDQGHQLIDQLIKVRYTLVRDIVVCASMANPFSTFQTFHRTFQRHTSFKFLTRLSLFLTFLDTQPRDAACLHPHALDRCHHTTDNTLRCQARRKNRTLFEFRTPLLSFFFHVLSSVSIRAMCCEAV